MKKYIVLLGLLGLASVVSAQTVSVIGQTGAFVGVPTDARVTAIEAGTSVTLANTHIFVGQSTAKALGVAVSGDLTVATNGAFTVANGAITLAKQANIATLSVIGRSTAAAGVPEVITGADGGVLRVSGTTLGFGEIATAGIADEAVTLAKQADIATLSVIGRSTAATGVPEVLSAADDHFVLRRSGTALGFGLLVDANIDAAAAIAHTKLAAVDPAYLLVGNAASQAVAVAVSGDITMSDAGAVAIASGVIVDADVNAAAAIAHTKLAAVDPAYLLVGNAASQAVAVAVSGDVTMTDAGAFALAAGVVAPAELTADLADEILYVVVTGADAATNGTGTVTIQVKDAAGADLDESVVIRTWIGTADDYGPDALTDYSVSTGTLLQEVTADAQYVVVTDTNGVAVMAVDFAGAAAGTVYAWAEIQGKIGASGILELTAP